MQFTGNEKITLHSRMMKRATGGDTHHFNTFRTIQDVDCSEQSHSEHIQNDQNVDIYNTLQANSEVECQSHLLCIRAGYLQANGSFRTCLVIHENDCAICLSFFLLDLYGGILICQDIAFGPSMIFSASGQILKKIFYSSSVTKHFFDIKKIKNVRQWLVGVTSSNIWFCASGNYILIYCLHAKGNTFFGEKSVNTT